MSLQEINQAHVRHTLNPKTPLATFSLISSFLSASWRAVVSSEGL